MKKIFDAIVVGLGAAGSSTLFQLSKQKLSVLGIDQFDPPHAMGSSHGETRITRESNGEADFYVPLVRESNRIFEELEKETGTKLLERVGGLVIGPLHSEGVHGKKDFVANTIRCAKAFDIPHEVHSEQSIKKLFPQFSLGKEDIAYYEPGAGFLHPERCVETQLALAKKYGAQVKTNTAATAIAVRADGLVQVKTANDEFLAAKVVLSTGGWISELIPEFKNVFSVSRQVFHWFDIEDCFKHFSFEAHFPIFIWDLGHGKDVYGFPGVAGPNGGMKIATETYSGITTARIIERQISSAEQKEFFQEYVRGRLAHISNKVLYSKVCMYTTTPDHDFIVDYHPKHPQIVIVSPCSGHGFKHSTGIGRLVSEMVQQAKTFIEISPFSLQRFDIPQASR